jgi:predicted nucleotidyltransferase
MDDILEKISNVLRQDDLVEFAVLFGSFAEGKETPFSDVDIGVYVSRPMTLLHLGWLTTELEKVLKKIVDVVELNTALEKNPLFAYKVIAAGELIFSKNPEAFVDFKTRAILQYLDTDFLRTMVTQAFQDRLEAGKFAEGC